MKYRCIPCNHEFEAPAGGKKPRCPRCLKIHDVEPVESKSPKSGGAPKRNWVPAAVVLAALGIGAAYYFSKKSPQPEETGKVEDAKDLFETLNIPKDEAVDPCAVTPDISAYAEKTIDGKDDADALDAVYQSLLKLKTDGKWRPFPQREPRRDRPLTADKLLSAIESAEDKPVQATSYELSCLMLAAAKSQEVDASMVEILSYKNEKSPADPEGKFGRYGVVAGIGEAAAKAPLFDPWGKRSKDGAKADVVVLTERQTMAPYFGIGALSLLVRQDMSPALALNDIAIKLAPDNPYFRSGRGFIFAATGVPSESLVEFEKALKSRKDPVQRVNLSEILLLVNPMDKRAETEVQAALADMPDFARAHAVMGVIHLMRGEKDQAETELGLAEKLDPQSPSIAMYWARFYAATMHSEEAVAKAKQAVSLSGRSVSSLLGLAGVYREVAEFSEMRATLDEVYAQISTPTMAEQIKGIFGYDPAPEEDVASADDKSDTDADKGTDDSQFELTLGKGLGKGPSLGGGNSGLSLDTPGGGLGGALGGAKSPGLGGNDLQLDMNMNQ